MNDKISKDISVVFHNGSTYDNHFTFNHYITVSVPINKKITKIDKDGGDKIVNIPYRLKFIDSSGFVPAPLSSLVDNLSDGLYKCKDCESSLEYVNATKDSNVVLECLKCNKDYNKDFNKELINRYSSTYNFCKGDFNKFILLLRKGVYPYKYMDS